MREKAANPPAARPALVCSVACRYTALQSATLPSPKSAQKAMKPRRSRRTEGLTRARARSFLVSGLPGTKQRVAKRAALSVTAVTRQNGKSGTQPTGANRTPHTPPNKPPPRKAPADEAENG